MIQFKLQYFLVNQNFVYLTSKPNQQKIPEDDMKLFGFDTISHSSI